MDEQGHCKGYLTRFSEYIDGELPEDVCRMIEDHLKECSNCTIVYNTLLRTVELYHELPQGEQLPDGVRSRLFKRLSLEDSQK
ncbi:MAG TPA: zf-HC2 domain-containing protein [Anaerolineaceae bacterium]|nr:zf-HC2 domain-containing protein [Anaerolineaceae bacterium]